MPNKIILLGSDKEKLINFLINIDNKSKAAGSNDTLLLAETKTDEAGEEVVDELYKGGTSESRSYDELASPTGLLRLSGRQLIKPTRNPKSFDSSEEENEAKIFSLSEENGFLKYSSLYKAIIGHKQ